MDSPRLTCLFLALSITGCPDDGGGGGETSDSGTTAEDTETTMPPTTTAPSSSSTSPGTSTGPVTETDTGTDTGEPTTTGGEEEDATEEWTFTLDGDGGDDRFLDVTVDGDGNIYVVGYTEVTGEGLNALVMKFDPDGNEEWTTTHNSGMATDDDASGVVIAGNGEVIVCGTVEVMDEGFNGFVWRLNPDNGNEIWMVTHNGADSLDDTCRGVDVDSNGDILVAGTQESVDGDDIWIRKYDSGGVEVWTTIHDGSGLDDFGLGARVDSGDNVIVVGAVDGDSIQNEGFVGKYDSAGDEVWVELVTGEGVNTVLGVDVDGDDNVFIAGILDGSNFDLLARKYDSGGSELWSVTHNGPGGAADAGRTIAADAAGDSYVGGYDTAIGKGGQIWVHKIYSDGTEGWAIRYGNEEASLHDQADGVAVDADNNVIVAGMETVLGEGTNAWLRKYSQG